MHILTHWQIERIALLVGIHDMLVVLQSRHGTLCIVERQIHVVGIVGKDTAEVLLQGMCQANLQLGRQLRLDFGGHIGHQTQLVVHLQLLAVVAVRQIVINDGASRHQPAG